MMIPACSWIQLPMWSPSELVSQFHSILAPGPPKPCMWRWPGCKATPDLSWPMPISSICVDGFLNPSRFIFNISLCPSIHICSLCYLTKTKSMIISTTSSDSVFSIPSHLTVADPAFMFSLLVPIWSNVSFYLSVHGVPSTLSSLLCFFVLCYPEKYVPYVSFSFLGDPSLPCEIFLWFVFSHLYNLFCPSSIALHLLLTHLFLSSLNVSSSGTSCLMVSYVSGLAYLYTQNDGPRRHCTEIPHNPCKY